MNIQTILKWASKRSPEILTSLGCVGVGVTGYLAGKGAIKASYGYNHVLSIIFPLLLVVLRQLHPYWVCIGLCPYGIWQ